MIFYVEYSLKRVLSCVIKKRPIFLLKHFIDE